MNDIVFADKYSAFERVGAQKFNKCLKVLIPKPNGKGGEIAFGQDLKKSDWYAWGGYVTIPPYCNYKILQPDDKDLIVCIEQPLLSARIYRHQHVKPGYA